MPLPPLSPAFLQVQRDPVAVPDCACCQWGLGELQEVTVKRTTRCRLGLSARPEMKSPLPRRVTWEGSSRGTQGAPLTLGKKGRTDRGGMRRGREGGEGAERTEERREGGERREGVGKGRMGRKRDRGEARDTRGGLGGEAGKTEGQKRCQGA